MMTKIYPPLLMHRLAQVMAHLVVAVIALVVIGGATRVMEAGLACPDWPLCFGVFLPGRQMNLQVFLEWFHRLDAFIVGMAMLVTMGVTIVLRQRLPGWLPPICFALVCLVALQGGIGCLDGGSPTSFGDRDLAPCFGPDAGRRAECPDPTSAESRHGMGPAVVASSVRRSPAGSGRSVPPWWMDGDVVGSTTLPCWW